MEELFNILSSSARIDKSKRRKLNTNSSTNHSNIQKRQIDETNQSCLHADDEDDDDDHDMNNEYDQDDTTATIKSRDRTGKRDTSESKLRQVHIEEIAAFRRSMNIKLRYNKNYYDVANIADPISSFHEITCPPWWSVGSSSPVRNNDELSKQQQQYQQHFQNLHRAIQQNIEMGRWKEPTPIQMQLIPSLLHNRYDCIACAPTGSGKSGAFIIPALYIASATHSIFYGDLNKNDNRMKNENSEEPQTKKMKKKTTESLSSASRAGEIRVLIIAPSYELASQLHRETERLGTGKPGGTTCILLSKSNASGLIQKTIGGKNGIDVVIATPLRLCDAIQKGLSINAVRFIVLDEADRLLDATDGSTTMNAKTTDIPDSDDDDDDDIDNHDDLVESEIISNQHHPQSGTGQSQTFLSQIDLIFSHVPATAVRALFSATVTTHVRQLSESILRNPMDVTITSSIGSSNGGGGNHYCGTNPNITQELMFVGREEGKLLAIRQLVARGQLRPPVIVFVQSQERAQALFAELLYDNIHIDVIHAGRSKSARETAVANFRKGHTWVLICTDLVARGVDFRAVNMVINYDLPTTGVTYIHRIGRTGRAGRKGTAITLFTEMDFDNLRMIANVMKQSGCTVPDWMLNLKKSRASSAKHRIAPRRPDIDTTPSYDKKKSHKKQQIIKHNQQKKQSSSAEK